MCKIIVCDVTSVPHVVPRADLGVFAIVSVERRDALERIRTCGALLRGLGFREVRWRAGEDGGLKRGEYVLRLGQGTTEILIATEFGIRAIRAVTASVGGVSGFTGIGVLGDEMSKWRDEDTGVNPATEVVASITPTMRTQPLARCAWISSPWSTLDVHHKMFEAGNTVGQRVAYAPTWVANPTLVTCPLCGAAPGRTCEHDLSPERQAACEADTHIDEPDELLWEREYKAIPMPAVTSQFFDPAAVDRAMARWRE